MTTPFLLGFAESLVDRLLAAELIELTADGRDRVIVHLGTVLHEEGEGRSLVSLTATALLASEHVEELYADDEQLKELMEGLGRGTR